MKSVRTLAVAAALAGLAAAIIPSGQARELVYGSQLGPRHGFIRYAIPPFFAAVKQATNGAIRWKHVGGGAIVNFKSAVAGVKNGLVDAGFGIAVYVPAVLPSTALIHTMFFPGNDAVGMTGAALETVMLHCPSCQKEFRANNSLFLAGYDTTAYEYICRENVKSVAALKGLKIRTSGGGVMLAKMAGATPVAMSPAEATTALQRGTLDCVHGSVSWLRSYGYQDVAKSVLDYPMGVSGPTLSFLMSRTTWNSFTKAEKEAHVEAAPILGAEVTVKAYLGDDASVKAAAMKKGVRFNQGGAAEKDLFDRFYKAERARVIDEYTKKFHIPAAEILDNLEKAQEKWTKISAEVGTDIPKIEAALKREIYSKLDVDKM